MDAAFGTLAAEGFHVSDPSGRLLLLAAVGLDPFKHDLTSPEAIKALETAFLNVRAKLRRTLRVTGRLVLADAFVAEPTCAPHKRTPRRPAQADLAAVGAPVLAAGIERADSVVLPGPVVVQLIGVSRQESGGAGGGSPGAAGGGHAAPLSFLIIDGHKPI
jgi:hypothetical protein